MTCPRPAPPAANCNGPSCGLSAALRQRSTEIDGLRRLLGYARLNAEDLGLPDLAEALGEAMRELEDPAQTVAAQKLCTRGCQYARLP